MPLPYQFRDYPLAIFMGIAFVALLGARLVDAGDREVAVTVSGNCCDGARCPIVDSLASVMSTAGVKHQLEGSNTVVYVHTRQELDPRQIWDAVASNSPRPIRLTIDRREYSLRP
ncbi:MAG: hypothetical protein JNK76_08035 [Planctomycetales bacterium]|nr:hypothetical protein [Planctomycetales bacterium]